MVNMGDKLKTLRIDNRYTQKQIAQRLGVAISAISSYESGERFPSYDNIIKLARIYHVSVDYLVGMTERRTIAVDGLNEEQIAIMENLAELFRKSK